MPWVLDSVLLSFTWFVMTWFHFVSLLGLSAFILCLNFKCLLHGFLYAYQPCCSSADTTLFYICKRVLQQYTSISSLVISVKVSLKLQSIAASTTLSRSEDHVRTKMRVFILPYTHPTSGTCPSMCRSGFSSVCIRSHGRLIWVTSQHCTFKFICINLNKPRGFEKWIF